VGRKATYALLAGALWMLGFDVVPLAHMVFHDALEEHHHGHHHHSSGHHADDEPSESPTPAEHGDGSVAHRDLAANVPVPGVPPVLEALLAPPCEVVPTHEEAPADRTPRSLRARAPPTPTV
jgi:hypothetical protein